ncbi:MAG: bifunctional (p)ppGpp synthetase/guanosine-3',5'-bis(diphosphate) 3'-pyrophosphohydrolase [Acidobacteriota bacterium]|nr:bifunctional (p)ppGpp synthetase/guanosine-3',5'-bis(diphosphate) 3'-pyrophosphohydrolase [Acidobacteriota bacterium]
MLSETPGIPAPPLSISSGDSIEGQFSALLSKFREYRPFENTEALERAYRFAGDHHKKQFRDSGEPYLSHPLAVARILAEMRMDLVSIETGLLHDVVEDTSVTVEEVRKNFGPEVANCVDGVTKLSKLDFFSAEERQAESFRKMLLAMTDDVRVIIVKLADRLHNMRTLGHLSAERKERIARETLEIYGPIAHRLGMGKVRGELEDLAFQHLDPEGFAEVSRNIESKRGANEIFLSELRQKVEEELRIENIPARVDSRVKRAYSVYLKMKRQQIPIEQVYDLLALRIITDSVKSCYAALGAIHKEWRPVPGRIKDFIAIPRPNLYQSLHTSVFGPEGRHFEVQIRTEEMHRIAEEGIAAHWKYKEGRKGGAQDDQRIAWLRQLVEWQSEIRDSGEFLATLKVDLYPEEVYTFTPRGKVIILPRDATPVDFAYAIHSDIGQLCTGAKVNGRIVPLKYNLKNGDSVEIITQAGHKPVKDWLSFVKTARARNKIKHIIHASERLKAIEIGEKYLEKEAQRLNLSLKQISSATVLSVAADYGFSKADDLYAALGYGKFSARQVLGKLAPAEVEEAVPPEPVRPAPEPARGQSTSDVAIKVKGFDDLLSYRAKCCNPIKGEPVIGYVTRGKGVAVHSKLCPNVQNLMYEVDRKIDVEWARNAADTFPVRVQVRTNDRPGLLATLTSLLSDEKANIRSLEAKTAIGENEEGALIEMTIDIRDKKQLEKVVSSMRRIAGVRDVERLFQ